MQNFLEGSFHLLTLFLWKIIGESTAEFGNDPENLKKAELVVKKNKVISDAVHDWVIGIADALSTAMVLNADILDDAGKPVFGKALKEAKAEMEHLEGIVRTRFMSSNKVDVQNGESARGMQ